MIQMIRDVRLDDQSSKDVPLDVTEALHTFHWMAEYPENVPLDPIRRENTYDCDVTEKLTWLFWYDGMS